MLRTAILAAAIASAPFAIAPLRAQVTLPGDAALAGNDPEDFAEHDAAARAAGLVPLRLADLPPGTREVRYWSEPGLGYPHTLYRVVEEGTRVRGSVFLFWPGLEPDTSMGEGPGQAYADLLRESNRGRCADFARSGGIEACRGVFTREPDWRGLLQRAAAVGVWTLPDQSALPDDRILTLDGWGMEVELRAGSEYRAWGYSNPRSHRIWPQARQALAVAEAFAAVDAVLRRPDSTKVYRGVTTGAYQSEIRLCDGRTAWEFHDALPSLAERSAIPLPPGGAGRDARYYVEVLGEATPEWLARRWESKYPRVLQLMQLLAVKPWTGRECG